MYLGRNGSGKSTITQYFEKVGEYTNADDVVATSTKPDTAVKTGDSTNILLWSMVMVISLAGMLTALFFKRRRNR